MTLLRGTFGKFLAWHRVDKMLSNNTFLKATGWLNFCLKITRRERAAHAKMSRVYTLAKILKKIFVKKEGKLGTLFTIMV